MESVAESCLAQVGRTDFGRGKLISSGEGNGFENILDAALARRFSLRMSSKKSEGRGDVS